MHALRTAADIKWLRYAMEKMRPLDGKVKYQIDRYGAMMLLQRQLMASHETDYWLLLNKLDKMAPVCLR
jgi:hypothetical protein